MMPLSYNDVDSAARNGAIYNYNLAELLAAQQIVNAQIGYGNLRADALAATVMGLINVQHHSIGHKKTFDQTESHHLQIKGHIEQVQAHTAKSAEELGEAKSQIIGIKIEVGAIKTRLEGIHKIDVWILVVAIFTFIAAAIAAFDVIVKWLPSHSSDVVSESPRPAPAHSTNK